MVGVPRSKGCRICVQRRVKCDQTRPTCNNCKKGNRPCPGYGQDLKFQDEGVRLRKRFEPNATANGSSTSDIDRDSSESPAGLASVFGSTSSVSRDQSPGSMAPPTDHWDVVGLDMTSTERRTFLGLMEGKTEEYAKIAEDASNEPDFGNVRILNGSDESSNVLFAESFLFSNYGRASNPFYQHIHSPEQNQNALVTKFQQSLFPEAQNIPKVFRNHSRWLAHLPPLTGTNPLLDASVRAVTLVHIGRLNNSEPFIMESRPYYGQALKLLNKALQSKSSGTSNETLCAVILLSFYEMFASDNNDSWIRHAGGVSALMRARGPKRHRYGFDREIFLAYRYTLIIEAFQQDVPCFLAEPAWLQLSSDIHHDLKSGGIAEARIKIFDIAEEYYSVMVKLPELCAHAQAQSEAKKKGTPPPYNRAQLIEKLTAARVAFKHTFQEFEAALKRSGNAPTIKLNQRDPLISIEYEFTNTFISATYTGYWTVLSVLNLCLSGLQGDDRDMVQLYHTESKECSLNICRASAFMLTSSFLGPFFLIFGLRVALLVFEADGREGEPTREADWVLRKLFNIGDRHMGIAKHVPGYRAGISVEQLIKEFRAESAKARRANDKEEKREFERNVAYGQPGQATCIPPDIQYDAAMGVAEDGAAETSYPGDQAPDDSPGSWEGLNQIDDVARAWDDQDNFKLHQNMQNLNVYSDNNRSRSGSRSPLPTQTEQNFSNADASMMMPDMNFFDPMFGMGDVMAHQQGVESFPPEDYITHNGGSGEFYQATSQPSSKAR